MTPTERLERNVDAAALALWADDGDFSPSALPSAAGPDGEPSDSGLNRNELAGKAVYRHLADHQRAEAGWVFHPFAVLLGGWFDRFNAAFALRLPKPAIRLDPGLRRRCGGYFLPDHNEFGLWGEIAVAVTVAADGRPDDVGWHLGVLLHEMLHLEQELTGSPGKNNYHNVAYQRRAGEFGLVVDERGHQTYAPDSRFLDLLREYGVPPPRAAALVQAVAAGLSPPPLAPAGPRQSKSKLRKWTCGCTNVWVGVRVLYARCTRSDCGQTYLLDSDG